MCPISCVTVRFYDNFVGRGCFVGILDEVYAKRMLINGRQVEVVCGAVSPIKKNKHNPFSRFLKNLRVLHFLGAKNSQP